MIIETASRALLKTFSWRILATVTTMLLVYFFVGDVRVAATVGGLEVVTKMLLYYFHERGWSRVAYGRRQMEPMVLWFTGLSGSGKSTISEKVVEELRQRKLNVEYLDGDSIRAVFPKTGFSREDRDSHVKRVGHLASLLEKNGVFVVASLVSPYEESRSFIRKLCNNYTEVYVSTPLEECEKRDVKGLYAKARAGEIQRFTGISDPYEAPENPEIEINTQDVSIESAVNQVVRYVVKHSQS